MDSPLTISMILILEPVIGSIIGWIVGVDSIPQRWTIIGGLLMISGLALVTFGSDSQEDSQPPVDVVLGLAGLCQALHPLDQ